MIGIYMAMQIENQKPLQHSSDEFALKGEGKKSSGPEVQSKGCPSEEAKKIVESATCKLSELSEQLKRYSQDTALQKQLLMAIKVASTTQKTEKIYKFVEVEDQKFILSALPASVEEAHEYMDAAIRTKKCSLFVSCHEPNDDDGKRCNDFWENKEVLARGFDGASVVNVAKKTLQSGKIDPATKKTPEILETTLTLSDGRKITHLFYSGWTNHTPCPDEELLETLLQRMEEVEPSADKYIAINCLGGVGRTGAVGGSFLMRKRIQRILGSTSSSDRAQVKVNIPAMVCDVRTFKGNFLNRFCHIATVYSRTIAFCTSHQLCEV